MPAPVATAQQRTLARRRSLATRAQRARAAAAPETTATALVPTGSPSQSGTRSVARNPTVRAIGYVGAGDDVRELMDWHPGIGSPDSDTLFDRESLIGRASDLERNDPIAGGAINTHAIKTIGPGLVPQPRVDREYLGLSQDEASAWEAQAKRVFWAVAKQLDLTRRASFFDMQDQWLRTELGRGDVLAIRRQKARPGDLLALKLQLIEGDRLSNPAGQPDGERLVAGIEFDEDDAPTAYHICDRHPGETRLGSRVGVGPKSWSRIPAWGPTSGLPMVLHGFHQRRPGQTRGVPFLAPVILQLKQLSRYTEAELMAAVISAMFTLMIETPGAGGVGEVPSDLLKRMTGQDAPAAVGLVDGSAGGPAEPRLEPGLIMGLNPGETAKPVNPARPYAGYDPFFTAVLRTVGPAIDTPFEVLTKHFTASYSASRAALLELWEAIVTRRARVVRQFCQPTYEWILAEAIDRGLLDAPGFFDDPLAREAWSAAEWIGPAPGQLDEEKAARAAMLRIDGLLSTHEREAANLTGADWEETFAQAVKERRMMSAAGLDIEAVAERIRTEPMAPETDPGSAPVDPPDDPSDRVPQSAPQEPPR